MTEKEFRALLLQNTKCTGEEIGEAIFYNKVQELLSPSKIKTPEHLKIRQRLIQIRNSMSEEDIAPYNVYAILTQLVEVLRKKSTFCLVQFQNAYYRQYYKLEELNHKNAVLKVQEDYPVIFSIYQFNKIKELVKENRANQTVPFYQVYLDVIKAIIKNDISDNAITEALNKLKNERTEVKDFVFLEKVQSISSGTGIEYKAPKREKISESYIAELLFNGAEAIKKAYKKKTGKTLSEYSDEAIVNSFRAVIHDFEEYVKPEIEELKVLVEPEESNESEWETSSEQTLEISKYELLLSDFFESSSYSIGYFKTLYKSPLFYLKSQYPELFNSVDNYIKTNLPVAKDISLEDSVNKVISLKELKDFLPVYKKIIEVCFFTEKEIEEIFPDSKDLYPSENFYIRKRLEKTGYTTALDFSMFTNLYTQDLLQRKEYSKTIKETEDRFIITYNENNNSQDDLPRISKFSQEIKKSSLITSKEQLEEKLKNRIELSDSYEDKYIELLSLRDLDDIPSQKDLLKDTHEAMIECYQYILTINTLYDILVKIFNVDKKIFNSVKFSTENLEDLISNLNKKIYLLYRNIYGNEKDIEEQRAILKKLFIPIDVKKLKPTKKRINEAIDIINENIDIEPMHLLNLIYDTINVISGTKLWDEEVV